MRAEIATVAPSVRLSRIIPAPREDVFAAWLDAESICQWMRPDDILRTEAEIDGRAGGKFRIVMHGEANNYEMVGEYVEFDPPARLVFTWETNVTEGVSLLTLEFREHSEGTELVLLHERIETAETAGHYEKGWTEILQRLAVRMG